MKKTIKYIAISLLALGCLPINAEVTVKRRVSPSGNNYSQQIVPKTNVEKTNVEKTYTRKDIETAINKYVKNKLAIKTSDYTDSDLDWGEFVKKLKEMGAKNIILNISYTKNKGEKTTKIGDKTYYNSSVCFIITYEYDGKEYQTGSCK